MQSLQKHADKKTYFEAKDKQGSTIRHSNMAQVAKQKLPEVLSITSVTATTKLNGLLYFDPDSNLVIQGCMAIKGIIEAIPNRSFFIFVTNFFTKQEQFKRHEIPGRLNINVSTIVIPEAAQKLFDDE